MLDLRSLVQVVRSAPGQPFTGSEATRFIEILFLLSSCCAMLRAAPYSIKDIGSDQRRPPPRVRAAGVMVSQVGNDLPRPALVRIGVLPQLPAPDDHRDVTVESAPTPALACQMLRSASHIAASHLVSSVSMQQPSLAVLEAQDRKRLATIWLGFSDAVRGESRLLSELKDVDADHLLPLFMDRAPSTLRRHLSGWRQWLCFCANASWSPGGPNLPQLLDFLASLAEGSLTDRGQRRKKSALGILSSLRFAASKFQLEQLAAALSSPLVTAWQNSALWTRQRVKEALPLPLVVLYRLEQAVLQGAGEDSFLLCVILVMAWASLRWSDIQRLELASVVEPGLPCRMVLEDQVQQARHALKLPAVRVAGQQLGICLLRGDRQHA